MNRFLTLKPWTTEDVITCGLALAILLAIGSITGLVSSSSAFVGALGGLLLRHMALHGWTLLRGSLAQRIVLLCLWLVTIAAGGVIATMLSK